MSLWKIAWRSIQQRSLASALTAISMALGVALVVAVLVVHSVIDRSFSRGGEGYDLIVGAKGDPLQLARNTAFYTGPSTGNIPYSYYQKFIDGEFAPWTETVVPVCMGHSYKGFRVVGTTPDMFDLLLHGEDEAYEFSEGRNFHSENKFEAVVGAVAAKKTGLKVGDKFKAIHGTSEDGHVHEQEFDIVGILKQTGLPNDRALFVNMNGFYQLHADEDGHECDEHCDHEHAGDEHAEGESAEDHREITALLLCVKQQPPGQARVIAQRINKGLEAQAIFPAEVIAKFLAEVVGNVQLILLIYAVMVVIVAGIGIMVSIYNSMSDRRHEIAVMRALGASRSTVMLVILIESILLSLGGGALGMGLGHGLVGVMQPMISNQLHVTASMFQFDPIELVLIPGLIVLAALVGYMPAMSAYKTDVAKSLTANP